MSSLTILILKVLFSNYFHALPNTLNAKEVFLFSSAMVCEYVVIIFQNIFVEIFYVNNYKIILNN